MKLPFRFAFLIGAFFGTSVLQAQSDFYRFKSDFSIKEKETAKDQGRLVTGSIYYDKNLQKTAFYVRFPEIETWLVRDTFMYCIRADTVALQKVVSPLNEFSIFNLILSQQLSDFGLSRMGYTPGDVQQDGEQVISEWIPPESHKTKAGKLMLAQQNKRLKAVAIRTVDGKDAAKIYFQDYTMQNGLPVPGKIYQMFYLETGEFVRIITIKNIIINQIDEDNNYDFSIPAGG